MDSFLWRISKSSAVSFCTLYDVDKTESILYVKQENDIFCYLSIKIFHECWIVDYLIQCPARPLVSAAINPLIPDAHYSERKEKPFSLQIQRLEVDLKLNCGFLFFCTLGTNGHFESLERFRLAATEPIGLNPLIWNWTRVLKYFSSKAWIVSRDCTTVEQKRQSFVIHQSSIQHSFVSEGLFFTQLVFLLPFWKLWHFSYDVPVYICFRFLTPPSSFCGRHKTYGREMWRRVKLRVNPLVPDAHYSERRDN